VKLTVCLMVLLCSGCVTSGSVSPFCGVTPILIDERDVLVDGTARQILKVNETSQRLCDL